jgi:hypothetical protein
MSSLKTYAVLTETRSKINRDLEEAEAVAWFKEVRDQHPDLARFDTPSQVVAFLNTSGAGTTRDRSAVTRALIRGAQGGGGQGGDDSRWLSILIAAFFPVIVRTRSALGTVCGICPDEVDAMVLHSFTEAVATFPLTTQGKLAVVNLRWRARKLLNKELRKHNAWKETMTELPEDADDCTADDGPDAEEAFLGRERESLLSQPALCRVLGQVAVGEDRADIDMLLATHGGGMPLIDYVRSLYPHAGEQEFRQVYERCRRQRSRLMARLQTRAVALAMSHSEPTAALLYQEATDGEYGTDASLRIS